MGGARKGAGAPKGKSMRKAKAPPDPDITPAKVESLAALGMNGVDIAAYFGTSKSTISRQYSSIIAKGRERLKVTLRQAQIKEALGGSVVMLIWLGKQMLGQADKVESKTELSGEVKSGPGLSSTDTKAVKEWVKEIQAEVRATAGTE